MNLLRVSTTISGLLFCFIVWLLSLVHSHDSCERKLELKPNKIILPKQAISAGANFIKRIQVSSLNECYYACCNVKNCTTAIYKSKVSEECFLFDCSSKNVCVYTDRLNYDVLILSAQHPLLPLVRLDGFCDYTRRLCATNNSVCSDGRCVCQSGFSRRGTECVRSVCTSPDLQFQCANSSVCVAIYDRCNGVLECPDGSDEVGCVASPSVSPSLHSVTPSTIRIPNDHLNWSSRMLKSWKSNEFPVSIDDSWLANAQPRPSLRERELNFDEEYDDDVYTRSVPEWRVHASRPLPVVLPEPQPRSSSVADNRRWYARNHPLYPPDEFKYYVDSDEYAYDNPRHQTQQFHPPLYTHGEPYPSFSPMELNDMDWQDATPEERFRTRHNLGLFDSTLRRPPPFDPFNTNTMVHGARNNRYHVDRKELIDQSVLPSNKPRVWQSSADKNKAPSSQGSSLPAQTHQSTDSEPYPKHDANTGHTATLILAFGLGLVCCLVGLLIVEWRRRRKSRPWAVRNRTRTNNLPVLIGDRRPSNNSVTMNSGWRLRHLLERSKPTNMYDGEEEDKTLCNGLVL